MATFQELKLQQLANNAAIVQNKIAAAGKEVQQSKTPEGLKATPAPKEQPALSGTHAATPSVPS